MLNTAILAALLYRLAFGSKGQMSATITPNYKDADLGQVIQAVSGAIPGLGNLFKSRSGSHQKTNLLVFLRPRILRD